MDKNEMGDAAIVLLTRMAAQKAHEGFAQIYGEKWGEKVLALAKGEEDKGTQWRLLVTLAIEAEDKEMLRQVKEIVTGLGESNHNEFILQILDEFILQILESRGV